MGYFDDAEDALSDAITRLEAVEAENETLLVRVDDLESRIERLLERDHDALRAKLKLAYSALLAELDG